MTDASSKLRRRWFQFSLRTLLIVVTLVAGLLVAWRVTKLIHWVGKTDLQVSFVVTDAQTGQPIPQATIHIRVEPGGFCDDRGPREFTITTNDKGHAKHLCTNCMSFGSNGIFRDTFGIHLPWWWFHTTAAGYFDSDPAYLDTLDNARPVRSRQSFAIVTIPIQLQNTANDK